MATASPAALVLVIVSFVSVNVYARRPVSAATRCGAARVSISVSPLIRSNELRVLELQWNYGGALPGDRLALYDYDPIARHQWDSSRQHNEPAFVLNADAGSSGPGGPDVNPFAPDAAFPPNGQNWQYEPRHGNSRDPALSVLANPGPFPPGPGVQAARKGEGADEGGPPLAVVATDGLRSGWRATNVQERHVASGQLGYSPRCLGYWVVYERPTKAAPANDSEVLAVSCLRTRPTWMSDFRPELGRLRLVDLFIPGTHDSASVQENGRNNIIDRYTVTQDESILGQLIYGVRYIDLRVGFYSNKDVQWWANHGPVRMQPLQAVLSDIKAFLANSNEIVILDVQNFPAGFGKDNKIHLKLVHLLETELGEVMAYRDHGQGWQSRLEDVWSGGRRLIVAYDREEVLPASSKLWLAVRQFWGDAQTSDQLSRYAMSVLSQEFLRGSAWALMAELTPNARLIATQPAGSLRRLAHLVNRNVTAWAEGRLGENINTLAVDFVRSTGVVEAALWHNLRRAGVDVCTAFRLLDSV